MRNAKKAKLNQDGLTILDLPTDMYCEIISFFEYEREMENFMLISRGISDYVQSDQFFAFKYINYWSGMKYHVHWKKTAVNVVLDAHLVENQELIKKLPATKGLRINHICGCRGAIHTNIVSKINIEGFSSLKHFILDYNHATEIKGLSNSPKLENLYLNVNKIENIRDIEGIEKFTSLKHLDLSNNKFYYMHDVKTLINLTFLNLRGNLIKKIIGLDRLTNLKKLNLSLNSITEIEGVGKLINLETFCISENKIEEIKELSTLLKLRKLNVSNNRITKIEGLETLVNLENLGLSHNKIHEINGLTNQKNLKKLDLYSNKIKKIEGLDNLEHLEQLDLTRNIICDWDFKSMKFAPCTIMNGLKCLKSLKHINIRFNAIISSHLLKDALIKTFPNIKVLIA